MAIGALSLLAGVGRLTGAPDNPVAAPPRPGLAALEGYVRQWLELRAQTAEADRAWHEQQRIWQRELNLLEDEKAKLEATQHATNRDRQTIETEYETLRHDRDTLRHALRRLEPMLGAIESHLRAMLPLIPACVAPELHASLSALPRPPAASAPGDPVNVPARLQRLLALLAEVEALQNAVHVGRDLVELDGTRRELEVLYIGLAGAYACSADGSIGAVGRPSDSGWRWRAAPEVAPEVRAALAILNRAWPARWLHLPIAIEEAP